MRTAYNVVVIWAKELYRATQNSCLILSGSHKRELPTTNWLRLVLITYSLSSESWRYFIGHKTYKKILSVIVYDLMKAKIEING